MFTFDREGFARFRDYHRQDLVALGLDGKWRYRYRFTRRLAYFERLLRLCEYRRNWTFLPLRLYYLFTRWRFQSLSERLGLDIPLYVFGPGLSIAHGGGIVVNGDAIIGARCRIHQNVTVGAVRGEAPQVGDDVFIGPGSGLYGPIVVGDGAVIGPHALVNFPVGDGVTVFGQRGSIGHRRGFGK